jgi:hypothetical protein
VGDMWCEVSFQMLIMCLSVVYLEYILVYNVSYICNLIFFQWLFQIIICWKAYLFPCWFKILPYPIPTFHTHLGRFLSFLFCSIAMPGNLWNQTHCFTCRNFMF